MTEGAIRAHRDGIVTACSIVANGAAFDDAVERLLATPTLEVGVHLALVEERALTTGEPMAKNHIRYVLSRKRFDVERELRMQIERVLGAGLRVTHLNGHQHLHLLPMVLPIVEKLAAEYRIGYVRVVNDRGGKGGVVRRASIAALSALGRRVDPWRHTVGVLEAGHLTSQAIVRLLDEVEDGLTELVTHPGVDVDGYDWRYDWDDETRALCDPWVREAIGARRLVLTAPSQVA